MQADVLASVYLFVYRLSGLSAVAAASSTCCGINEVVDLAACVGSLALIEIFLLPFGPALAGWWCH